MPSHIAPSDSLDKWVKYRGRLWRFSSAPVYPLHVFVFAVVCDHCRALQSNFMWYAVLCHMAMWKPRIIMCTIMRNPVILPSKKLPAVFCEHPKRVTLSEFIYLLIFNVILHFYSFFSFIFYAHNLQIITFFFLAKYWTITFACHVCWIWSNASFYLITLKNGPFTYGVLKSLGAEALAK